jgi:hypothetical protein
MYVVVTRYVSPRGRAVTHAYGPYADKAAAMAVRREMVRDAKQNYSERDNAHLTYNVLEVLTLG